MTQHVEYALPGVPISLPDRRTRVRAAVGIGCWLGAPPLLLRLLGRNGRRRELHRAARWWAGGLRRHLAIRLELEGVLLDASNDDDDNDFWSDDWDEDDEGDWVSMLSLGVTYKF